MKKAKARVYDAHLDYDIPISIGLLNTKIKIFDENFQKTSIVYYEGTIGKFLKERVPSDSLVEVLTQLNNKDRVSYNLNGVEKLYRKNIMKKFLGSNS